MNPTLPWLRLALLAASAALSSGSAADGIEQQARRFAVDAVSLPGARVEVEVGALDPRLRLAPCERVEPYLPAGTRLWGRSRIGLRCAAGAVAWKVYLPLTVRVYAPATVAARALPAGALLAAGDLQSAEVDLAAGKMPITAPEAAIGRKLARALAAGEPLRGSDLRPLQWFAAGETVQIEAVGAGFRISSEAQALTPGMEGQPARLRTSAGKILSALPVGERRVEIKL